MKAYLFLPLLLVLAVALAGCGQAATESAYPAGPEMAAPAMVATGEFMGDGEGMSEKAVEVEKEVVRSAPAEVALAPATMSAATGDAIAGDAAPAAGFAAPSYQQIQASVATQNRIIVRTVAMTLVVEEVSGVVDEIVRVAVDLDGWVVSSDRSSRHAGAIAIRVPAQSLDAAVRQLRQLAVEVAAESSTSQDVTDEYVDSNSRVRSLRATEESLLELLGQASDVEDTLLVRAELAQVQAEIEGLLGRIKYLEQTAAYSLINVNLRLAPQPLVVDAGADRTFGVGQDGRFRAYFTPPVGIEDFEFTWDFGDGSEPVRGDSSAPTTEPGQRVTATVNHFYDDDRDSPYIVQLEISGTGPAGVVEGSDTLIATVTRAPTIEVFAGEGIAVEEDTAVALRGSFTRPEGLRDIQYRWDFGDGTAPVSGIPEPGVTNAFATHTYQDYRPQPYEVTLTVTAESAAGPVEGFSALLVQVTEAQGLVLGGWSAGDTARTATRALSVVGQGLGTLLIWLGIFSPLWLGTAAVVYGIIRWRRSRRGRPPAARAAVPAVENGGAADAR